MLCTVPFPRFAPLLLALVTAAAPLAADGGARRAGRTVDVTHLDIDLRLDWAARQARGSTVVTCSPLRATASITLDAGNLAIESITGEDGSTLAWRYDGGDRDQGLAIELGRVRRPGETVRLTIAYHTGWRNISDPNSLSGSDGKGIRFLQPSTGEPVRRRQAWSVGYPAGNRYWFPGNDSPEDLRTTDLRITVDHPLTVVSSGALVETRANPDGTRTFHWRVGTPYANYLTAFAAGEWTLVPQRAGDVEIESYGYPDERDAVAATVERLPDMLRWFSELTGKAFPHPVYRQVFVQDLPWGWGNFGTATLTENMVDDFRTHAEWRYLWDGLEAEALAHQWAGGWIVPRDWRDAWLARGLSRMLDGLYNEHKNGRDEFLLYPHNIDQATTLGDWRGGTRHPIVPRTIEEGVSFAADNYPYFRGALVHNLLREELGDSVWRAGLRRFIATHGGQPASTADYQRAMEQASGRALGWFFEQWVYRIGHPVFEVERRWDRASGTLTLTLRQVQQPDTTTTHPKATWFRGRMTVEIDDRLETVTLAPKAVNQFRLAAREEPRLVRVDVGDAWIKEIRFSKTTDELLYQLARDRDVLGRRWAMSELARLYRRDGIEVGERQRIEAGLRDVAQGDGWWRLRLGALTWLQGLVVPAGSGEPVRLDSATTTMLVELIRTERSWVRSGALTFLGATRDPRYAELYLDAMQEDSHQVIYAAAAALGKSRSPRAYDALTAIAKVPSWKGENILSALLGLKELGDPRGADLALAALNDTTSHRWTLGTPVWDFRIAASQTLVALGRADDAWRIASARLTRALEEDDVLDQFNSLMMLADTGDPRTRVAIDLLKARYKDDPNALAAIGGYEAGLPQAGP
ncbi:MAG: M1 family aminopeptidase [Gemmatimonadales bacterium]